ncbi:serine hydrolase domain-containing protein [Nocardia jejuensis]|uniref:serine hydrolase domain-containing protein n=1 Tax=Nocardia jejuensis TaxID=328049 RepID=UPI00082F4E30|nr:serine hydrolase domain-containing protein [Nocardia jejuensis]
MRIKPIAMPIALALALCATAGCSSVPDSGSPAVVTTTPISVSPERVSLIRDDIDALARSGIAGVIATLTENGQTMSLTAGVADRATDEPIPLDPPQEVRVGSISKTFVSSIIMQLVAEGRVRLDDPVDTYLPGLLVGDGVDGKVITVRQLLQHRSGLPELTDVPEVDEYRAGLEGRRYTPGQEIAMALRLPAQFAPGATFEYTNTNYIVAAMIVEKVTGRGYSDELSGRILTPEGLSGTYLPAAGELDIRPPHPQGYARIDGVRTDVTRSEPSVPWAAGALVSTGADLNRFYLALLAGRIVADAQLGEMLAPASRMPDSTMNYGMGIGSTQLSCGAEYFGHTGGIAGFVTIAGATREGRAVTLTLTEPPEQSPDVMLILGHALCP